MKKIRGFTLIELLVVIAIISSLAVVVFTSVNPGRRIREARNSRRAVDTATILNAVHAFIVDSKGTLPVGITTSMTEVQIGTGGSSCTITSGVGGTNEGSTCSSGAACFNVSAAVPVFLKSNPVDPSGESSNVSYDATRPTQWRTGYTISSSASGVITIKNCFKETPAANIYVPLSVSR